MPIVVLPKTLTAHTDAVAADVMANFNKLLALVNGELDGENLDVSIRQRLFEPGDLKPTARSEAPEGWLLCDGSAVSRATYSDLFAAIGTTYGAGNGSTTFNLPDLRGRVPLGPDGSAGRLSGSDALGNSGGAEKHQLVTSEIPSHGHGVSSITIDTHSHGVPIFTQQRHEGSGFAYNGMSSGGNTVTQSTAYSGGSFPLNGSTDSTGGGGSHTSMQPYLVVNWLVKT